MGAESRGAHVIPGCIRRIDRTEGSGGVWVGELKSSGKSFDVSQWEMHDAWENAAAGQPALHVGKQSGVPE